MPSDNQKGIEFPQQGNGKHNGGKKHQKRSIGWIIGVVVLILISITFILPTTALSGSGSSIEFGRYNGEKIELEYGNFFYNQISSLASQYPMDAANSFQIYYQAYYATVFETALRQMAEQAGIRTTDSMVNDAIIQSGYFSNENGDDELDLNRAYVNGRVGGMDLQAGRWDEVTFTGNVLDSYVDGVKVSYGDKVQVFGIAAKGAGEHDAVEYMNNSEDRLYVAGVTADLGAVDVYAAYFKTDASKASADDETAIAEDLDKEIWNVGVSYNFAPDFTLAAEYMRGDKDYYNTDKDGWYADLAWKGASADEPGSYGLHVGYFDQSANAYISPTTDGFVDSTIFKTGYKGMAYGASYAFAKNIVGVFNYYDFESKEGGQDADTMFTEVYFTF